MRSICENSGRICGSFEKSREIKRQTFNYFAFHSRMFNQQKRNILPCRMTYCAFHHASQLGVMRSTKRNYKLQHVHFRSECFFSHLRSRVDGRLNTLVTPGIIYSVAKTLSSYFLQCVTASENAPRLIMMRKTRRVYHYFFSARGQTRRTGACK